MMRLFSWLFRKTYGQMETDETTTLPEARAALERAESDLRQVKAQRGEVNRLATELRTAREANHFGQRLALSYERRGSQ